MKSDFKVSCTEESMEDKTRAIGGYFELELSQLHSELHSSAIALNSGRFCLEYILRCRKYSLVYVPYFTCDSAVEPIIKLGISYKFYHIDESYHISDDIVLKDGEALMYTNYWGLQDAYCKRLSERYGASLILDYTQAFYSMPISGIDTFYSCRKYFGVPDGGYLYTDALLEFEIEQDFSYDRMDSLIKRIDISPEAGYQDFHSISSTFHDMSIRRMSNLTQRLMNSINYELVAEKRRSNFNFLRDTLGGDFLPGNSVPMIFPYVAENGIELRKFLINNRIFVAKYWPNVDAWVGDGALETWMANNILSIPIDQRYDIKDMERIVKNIELWRQEYI